MQYLIHPGTFADVTALQTMDIDLPAGSELFADSGYTDYQQQDYYTACEHIHLRIVRKSRRVDAPHWLFLKKTIRQKIESRGGPQTSNQLTRRFPKHIHVVTQKGFILQNHPSLAGSQF